MNTTVVIFGASGDLTARKLVPGLYNLKRKGRLPAGTHVVGFARRPYTSEDFRALMRTGVEQFAGGPIDEAIWKEFAQSLSYFRGNLDAPADYASLDAYLKGIEGGAGNRLYYLSTSPEYYAPASQALGAAGLSKSSDGGWRRIIIEKPFGHDLESALALNDAVHSAWNESQVYRIDHYLGKETAQNVLFFRFANTMFEPVWNRNYIDNIQITVAETVDVGHRAGYYEQSGVLRDMFQNHLLQLLTLVTMEPPSSFSADAVRNEKLKVLNAIRAINPADVVLGQYAGYRDAEGIAPGSKTPTYGAIKLYVDNWRWHGVPIYIRCGKALAEKTSEINIQFQPPPHTMFMGANAITPNTIRLFIQPNEGISVTFSSKVPDTTQQARAVDMRFNFADVARGEKLPEAYERLQLDAMLGDASLFIRSDEIVRQWELIDPLIKLDREPTIYARETWGPPEADGLVGGSSDTWLQR